MNSASTHWNDAITRPDFAEWPRLLDRQEKSATSEDLFVDVRQSARRRLVDAARQHTRQLRDLAGAAGVQLPASNLLTGDPDTQPVVLTGHQPVQFHGGLTYKYYCAEDFCAANNTIGVAITIDTDAGDPGAFVYPSEAEEAPGSVRITEDTFCDSSHAFFHAKFLPMEKRAQLGQRAVSDLEAVSLTESAARFGKFYQMVQKLSEAGVSPAEANVICRWSAGIGSRLLEVPLSAICDFPEVTAMTVGLIEKAEAFAQTYNDELDQFRTDHKIRNPANPFPNMSTENDSGQELPFWVYDSSDGSRSRLSVRTDKTSVQLCADGQNLCQATHGELQTRLKELRQSGKVLVPRGALVSAWLRLLFADLFIHGLGGEHYDPFTDRLIQKWWRTETGPFVTASASEYLFNAERSELERLKSVESKMRDLRFNPQRHFGADVFTNEQEKNLQALIDRKQSAIASMKTAHADGRSAKDIGHEIQLISDEIRACVDAAFQNDLDRLAAITPDTKEAWNCRTYPWFLFG